MSQTRVPRRPRQTSSLVPSQDLFLARARSSRRRFARRLLVGAALLAAVATAVWLVWFSSVLTVRTVAVVGVDGAQAAAVRAAADVPMGRPLVEVDTSAIAARVRERPDVASVRVERSWPRTVTVRVSPRAPVLVLVGAGGGRRLVDGSGVAYAAPSSVPRGLPVAVATSASGESPEAVRAVVGVVTSMSPALLREVTKLQVEGPSEVSFRLRGITVDWGGTEAPERKARIVRALLAQRPRVIDVSAPDTPVTR